MRLTIRLATLSPAARSALSAAANRSEYVRTAIEEFATGRTEQAMLAQLLVAVQRLEETVLDQAKRLDRIEEILVQARPARAIDSDARKNARESNLAWNQALAMATRWVGGENEAPY